MKNVYFLLSALLMWNCCAESNYRTSATPDFKEIYRLQGDSLPVGELFIPLHLKTTGQELVLFDNSNREGVITVAGYPGLNFKYRAVRKGRGRDEFISTSWTHTLQPDRIALYDIPGAVLVDFTIQKDTLVPGRQYDLTRKKEGTDLTRPYVDIIQLNDSVFFMRSSDRSRDELTVDNLVTGKTLWTVKDIADRDLSKDQYLDYNYYIAAGKNNLIKFYETEDRIEIYSIGPDYRTVPQLVLTGTRYLWMVCAKDVFYALAGDYIHVFDYKGNPVRKFLLDKPMDYFIWDEKNGRILGFNSAGESEVFYIYELPSREG